MRPIILPLLLLSIACSQPDEPKAPSQQNKPDQQPTKPAQPEKRAAPAKGEPDYITVDHILISFNGGGIRSVTRPLSEAKTLAERLLKQIQAGDADWNELKKEYSDDPGPTGDGGGPYAMSNIGAPTRPDVHPRTGMVPAFGDVGFSLKVGEIKMATYDPKKSPYGYHIIKRVK